MVVPLSKDHILSIVIVNYNAGTYMEPCLRSIEAQTLTDYEVIIVDNASHDDSLQCLRQFPWVKLIKNEKNLGFAAAQNLGLRLATGRYLMPLNFDIQLTPTFFQEMVTAIESSRHLGSVTGKLMQMSPAGQLSNQFYSTGHLLPPNRFPVHRGAGEEDRGQFDQMDGNIFGCPGAAPLYRREMLDDIVFRGQYFDESLFTWYEDVDLDWRARWRGWKCAYTPRAVAFHVGHPHGLGHAPKQIAFSIRNRWLMVMADECAHCARNNKSALVKYELGLVRHVVRSGLLSSYVSAVRQFTTLRPVALEKRKHIMARAQVGCPLEN